MRNFTKKLKAAVKLLEAKFLNRHIPLEINIHITDTCNMRCTYCYSNFYKRGLGDIPKADCMRIIDEFRRLGSVEVSLIGGEPFLHPHIRDLIGYIKKKGLLCTTVTNGCYLDRHLDAVKELDMVCVSLDGPQEINDITRGKGTYKQAVKALGLLKRENINRSIRATLQKHNIDYIDEIFAIALRYGALLNFGLLFPQSSDDGTHKIVSRETPSDSELKKALGRIITLKKKYPGVFFNSLANFKNAYDWPAGYRRFFLYRDELKEFPSFNAVPCSGGRAFATVDTDGRLYPCTNLIGYYDAPNVLETDIKEAWRSINNHTCSACFYLSSVEKNLVCSLNPSALWNIIRVGRSG